MPAEEFVGWQAYFAEEPFGPVRDNLHMAVLASLIANIHAKPGADAIGPEAFMFRPPGARKPAAPPPHHGFRNLRARAKPKRKPKR